MAVAGDFKPSEVINPFPPRGEVEPGFARLEQLITPQKLRDQYLFGIPLKSTITSQEMSDDTLKDFIIRAVSRVEHEVKIPISPVKFVDKVDYNVWDYSHFNFIQLDHWPVLQIESFKAKFPHTPNDFIQYPEEWFSVYNEFGIFQLTPTSGSIRLAESSALLP